MVHRTLMLKCKQGCPAKDRPPSATDGRLSVWHADSISNAVTKNACKRETMKMMKIRAVMMFVMAQAVLLSQTAC